MRLRDYQARAIAQLRAQVAALPERERRALLVAPTGAGKTTCAAGIIAGAVAKGSPVLFLAHRKELIDQAEARMTSAGLPCGVIKAGRPATPEAPVQVASVQTLTARKQVRPPARVIVVDEAHRTLGASYMAILADYPDATVIGLTATPIRLDGRGLGDVYGALVEAASVGQLVADGYLVKPRVFAPATPDLAGVKTTAGDFNQLQLASAMNKPQLVGDVVTHWQRLAGGQRTVVFASSVEHSRAIALAFQAAGVAAEHLDGEVEEDEREAILARLANGTTRVVTNFGVLVEGWDCPACAVVVLARPTKSLGQYLQMVGRIMRPDEGKQALVLDHAGCTFMHGLVTEERAWSLDAKRKAAKDHGQAQALKGCPACYAMLPALAQVCDQCGHAFPKPAPARRAGPEVVGGDLHEVTEAQREARKTPPPPPSWWRTHYRGAIQEQRLGCESVTHRRELYAALAIAGRKRGYKPSWAKVQFNLVTGRDARHSLRSEITRGIDP